MSVPNWPEDLPRPMRNNFQSQLADPRKRKAAENGPAGYRRKYSSVAREYAMMVDVARFQKAIFDNFYEREVKFGARPFWMMDPTTDGWSLLGNSGAPLLTETGAPILLAARWLCQFGDTTPVESIKGIRFRISFNVLVLP